MAASQPPRGDRRGTSTYRYGDEVTLHGDETENELSRAPVTREPLQELGRLRGRGSHPQERAGTTVDHVAGETVLVGQETADDVSVDRVIELLPTDSRTA